ncbi:MAG: alpha-E domain-containing protein [Myxococcota bacterium]
MISRSAEGCFWQNRYLERAETLARLLGGNLAFQLDVQLPDAERWRPLLIVTGEEERFDESVGPEAAEDGEAVQQFLTWEEENPSSLVSSLFCARENARTVREITSLEMWETLNALWLFVKGDEGERLYRRDRYAFYREVRDRCLLFHAHSHVTMLHEEPFDFMRMGTALERAAQTARLLDVKYHSLGPTRAEFEMPAEAAQWLAVLRFCSGIEPFFKRGAHVLSGPNVAAFLLFDESFPRSVQHNLSRAGNFLQRISGSTGVGERSRGFLEALCSWLEQLTIEDVLERSIHDVLEFLVESGAEVCAAIHQDFFDPGMPAPGASGKSEETGVERPA